MVLFSPIVYCEELVTLAGFTTMMLSMIGDAFNPAHDCVYQDMDQPLNQYYIASSHNTFLQSHQLRGNSSKEMYARVLQQGCRCVEIDCWNGDDGQTVVTHGGTLTTKIKFNDVCDTINKHKAKQ